MTKVMRNYELKRWK